MSYWIQEYGTGANRDDFKFFHCDAKADISKLPTNTTYGTQEGSDDATIEPCKPGDQCLCLEDSSVYELRGEEYNDWKEI